jgi:hypothetical protein
MSNQMSFIWGVVLLTVFSFNQKEGTKKVLESAIGQVLPWLSRLFRGYSTFVMSNPDRKDLQSAWFVMTQTKVRRIACLKWTVIKPTYYHDEKNYRRG